MASHEAVDYYEVLQISPNAEPEIIHRAYRLLAQRFHPDNKETGNVERFRQLTEAYEILSHPERRAQYDVGYAQLRKERWHLVSKGADSEHDFATEQRFRLTVLEVLYTRRRIDPEHPGMTPLDIETLIGLTRDQQEFTIWYLVQKKYVTRNDSSLLIITVDGAEYLESNYREVQRLRLKEAPASVRAAI